MRKLIGGTLKGETHTKPQKEMGGAVKTAKKRHGEKVITYGTPPGKKPQTMKKVGGAQKTAESTGLLKKKSPERSTSSTGASVRPWEHSPIWEKKTTPTPPPLKSQSAGAVLRQSSGGSRCKRGADRLGDRLIHSKRVFQSTLSWGEPVHKSEV